MKQCCLSHLHALASVAEARDLGSQKPYCNLEKQLQNTGRFHCREQAIC